MFVRSRIRRPPNPDDGARGQKRDRARRFADARMFMGGSGLVTVYVCASRLALDASSRWCGSSGVGSSAGREYAHDHCQRAADAERCPRVTAQGLARGNPGPISCIPRTFQHACARYVREQEWNYECRLGLIAIAHAHVHTPARVHTHVHAPVCTICVPLYILDSMQAS